MTKRIKENQSFATLKLLWGILILNCLLRNKTQKEHLALPLFPAQEIPTENPALGREPGLNHLKNFHLALVREPPSLLARFPPPSNLFPLSSPAACPCFWVAQQDFASLCIVFFLNYLYIIHSHSWKGIFYLFGPILCSSLFYKGIQRVGHLHQKGYKGPLILQKAPITM